jgi:hypothetical protein
LKKFITLLILICIPAVVHAADPLLERPHWSLEIKGGTFTPALSDWAQYYEKKSIKMFEGSLAYKPIRQIDIGISGGYGQAKGKAFAPLHNAAAGNVTYKIAPLSFFVLLRGVVSENQWIVPYAGGGFTRLYYAEEVEGQDTIDGSVDGYHARGGLQFLLDVLDQGAANNMYMDYGIHHTYLFFEAEYTHAVVRSVSVNLGGTAYLGGLLFEF